MHMISILLALLLAGLGFSTERGMSDIQVGNWTLKDNRIDCDFAQCSYSFHIYELEHDSLDSCNFTVVLSQNQTTFQDVKCGTDSKYAVNGGIMYNFTGVVLCFTNTVEGTWAFFGFDSDEFLSGPTKNSPAYPIGEWHERRDINSQDVNRPAEDFPFFRSEHCRWGISWGQRVINTTGIHIDLLLMDTSHNELHCIVNLAPPENADAQTWSFYNQNCRDNDWSISWIYQSDQDAAVMTIADPNQQRQAWFGWSGVNSNTLLYPVRSNAMTAYCGC